MTAPISHGYPDWGRTVARSNIIYHNVVDTDIDAQEVLPVKFCGDRAYIQFEFEPNANHFSLSFRFFMDSGLSVITGTETWNCRTNQAIFSQVATQGPWFDVVVTPSAVNGQYAFKAWGNDVPIHMGGTSYWDNNLLALNGVSIGAGVTRTDELPAIFPGPATWGGESTAASWTSHIEGINHLGGTSIIDRLSQGTVNDRRYIFLPRSTVQVRTTNNDAGARVFVIFVTAHPSGRYG